MATPEIPKKAVQQQTNVVPAEKLDPKVAIQAAAEKHEDVTKEKHLDLAQLALEIQKKNSKQKLPEGYEELEQGQQMV